MQSGLRRAFGTLYSCMLRRLLLICALHAFSNTMLAVRPSLSASAYVLFSLFLASIWSLRSRPPMISGWCLAFGTLSCCMLRYLWFFGALRVCPNTVLACKPSLEASGKLAFQAFLASLLPLKSHPAMLSGSCPAFGSRSASLQLLLLLFALIMCSPVQCWHLSPPFFSLEALLSSFVFTFWPLKSRPACRLDRALLLARFLAACCNITLAWLSCTQSAGKLVYKNPQVGGHLLSSSKPLTQGCHSLRQP